MMVLLKRAGGLKGPPALFSELNNKKMGANASKMCLAVKWSLANKIINNIITSGEQVLRIANRIRLVFGKVLNEEKVLWNE